ncbi:MAG: MarR family winged helix-turn-helix transcriptional regulator [Clostridiales bacterium]|jgi:DNA-binding MarR family transcriptional regulator|nr:MarR family winged helix-turn-helix transcriptional regulator [Clostridiales bacterium]
MSVDFRKLATELTEKVPVLKKQIHFDNGIDSVCNVLLYIASKEQVIPKEISDLMGISSARVAVVLNELEEKLFITREIDNSDRRQIIVKATQLGRELSVQKKEMKLNKITTLLQKLGEKDAVEYVRLTSKVGQILSAMQCDSCK